METSQKLAGLREKIAARLAVKAQVFIAHPAELRLLRSITASEVRRFAAENGWRVTSRVGGRQIEFYNDAGTRTQR
jgi:hypothetical protein